MQFIGGNAKLNGHLQYQTNHKTIQLQPLNMKNTNIKSALFSLAMVILLSTLQSCQPSSSTTANQPTISIA